jgi:hypothetical protein
MSKAVINLLQLDSIGLIISHPTGVVYSNQTGGYACLSPQFEGAFIPLNDPLVDQQTELERYFIGSKWRGHCYNEIDEETADFVDEVLASTYVTKRLKVNRDKLTESHEAWIHVVILPPDDREDDLQEFHGFSSNFGVLTWKNSD